MALTRAERRGLRRAFDVAGIPENTSQEWEEIPELVNDDGTMTPVELPQAEPESEGFQAPLLPDELEETE